METRVFFYSNHREDDPSIGITKKVHAQIRSLRERGFIVFFSAYVNQGIGIFDNNDKLIEHYKVFNFNGKIGHWKRRTDNLKHCMKFIKKNNFSILYMRFHFWDRHSVNLLKTADAKGMKVIVEAHSYPYVRKKVGIPMKIIYFMDRIYTADAGKYINLVAAVTEMHDSVWGCKTVKIQNALSVDDIEVRDVSKVDSEAFRIVCVANETSGHGVERILHGIAEYNGNYKVELCLIGEYRKKTLQIIHILNIEDKVKVVGKLYGNQLREYYSISHIGVGLLAGYLVDIHMGTVLKTKEYMAVGLPFFTSASSEAEINEYPYALVVSEDDSPIDVKQLIRFVQGLNFTQEDAENMHEDAVRKYQWSNEFDKVFAALG